MRTTWLAGNRAPRGIVLLALAWLALVIVEAMAVSYVFDFPEQLGLPGELMFFVTRTVRLIVVSCAIFCILARSEAGAIYAQWVGARAAYDFTRALAVNIALFAALLAACAAVTVATSPTSAWLLLMLTMGLVAATGLSLIAVLGPLGPLASLMWRWRSKALLSGTIALATVVASEISIDLTHELARATLHTSAAILRLYENDVLVDLETPGIRVGDFGVAIWYNCSGVEGFALVAGFVTVYLLAFKSELRFPRAFLLYPVGLAASWILNAVRIAALTSIGAHVSPEIAQKGFHSQAGWIAFLAVALGMMWLAGKTGLVEQRRQSSPSRSLGRRGDETTLYLVPFVAMMIGSVAMATAAPYDLPLYVLKVALISVSLGLVWRGYEAWQVQLSIMPVLTGALVGVAWIATAVPAEETRLGIWLAELDPVMAFGWLAVRGLGTIVLVPIAEELAFRGYLYRRLIARDFFAVSPRVLSCVALVISSALFGVLHDRWLAAALAGALFTLVMLRSGRIGDAILAHAAANAVIFGWAIAARQWALL